MRLLLATVLSTFLAAPVPALAQASAPLSTSAPERVAPVIQLSVDVPPYYVAGASFGVAPGVAVDPAYDKLLASTKRDDIQRAVLGIAARPELVKPETLIVLAMRLYDVGLRDDAVFWYYAGRDRFLTMEQVLDMRSIQLTRSADVVESFLRAAGPAMDGYAYCSIAHQAEQEDRAIAWVAAHPYKILGYTELPAVSEDRNAALADAVNHLRDASRKKKALLGDPKTLADLEDARRRNHAHERYCW
jgi:hypothetical protein